ncbi:hypothetical protein [Natronobacterium gregoryi]|uniref:Uncharacterized protein n=2 Tax=Natronobacterium gregoryi TaxID=44930 RepID=L0ALE7_NATGS|nr:hypothetical protein [Natronobacterium gregoryi]AFZ74596.1 hypothetical protein Natgr_3477 [Natronobacterium gregoryi SP2]ELY72580.1 hypothetical protein C490_03288 [Natronobacterium gregoryi SP2]PLK19786.1 hypothetical protein CYV19_12825 [Natronobacterium gregoryi SP2]SFJ30154.1 hypothetical protein SAMN05443661_12114 [Natronobacterium gregoryi]
MTTDRDHDENPDESAETETDFEAAAGAVDRIPDDTINGIAKLVDRLTTSQKFDDAEARANHPEPLEARPTLGGHRLRVDGDQDGEWLTTNYAVPAGDAR